MARTRIKKYVLDLSNEPSTDNLYIIGIKTHAPLHKIAYHLNLAFDLKLFFHLEKITVNRKKKELKFDFFTIPTDENTEAVYLVNNETLYEIDDPNGGLFSSSEAFYMIPELENINYLLFIPKSFNIDMPQLQQFFDAYYQVKWVAVNMEKLGMPIPNFPV